MSPVRRHRPAPWAVILFLASMVGLSGCGSDASPNTQPSPCGVPSSAPASTDGPADQAPGGGGIQVVDHGYTQVGGNGYSVSLGAFLRNTSRQIAYRTVVMLRVTDAQGRAAADPLNAAQLVLEVPVIRPGQQVAIGSSAGLRTDLSPSGAPDKVTAFEVVLGAAHWLPAADAVLFPTFTTTYRGLERDDKQPESGSLWYSVTSNSCRPLVSRGTAAVFVNPAGAIVGGAFDPANGSPRCGSAPYSAYLLTPRSIPTGIDEAKTQVTSYCDPAPVGANLKPSGAPFN